MKTRFWSRAVVAGVLVIGGATALDFVARMVPSTTLGWNRFHLLYNGASDKSAFLEEYRGQTWEHGGGSVPDAVAVFLAERLERSNDAREVAAIVRFWAQQAGGREHRALFALSDKARRRVAQTVLRDWKVYPPHDGMQHGFVLLECLRQNTYVGKANVIAPHGRPDSVEKTAPVAALFAKWNRKYAAVPFAKRPNPLAGTPYTIEAP